MEKLTFKNYLSSFALILFISCELSYYLLIAQTGIVEYFNSDLFVIAFLPIGGVFGSLLTYYLKISIKNKIVMFLTLQLILSLFYPNYTSIMLFILGISVGALAPLLINELKKSDSFTLSFSLIISYVLGTNLFNYDVSQRDFLAILLSFITLISFFFIPKKTKKTKLNHSFSLINMSLWVFLDSTLFETLSRSETISIWRDGFTFEIAIFHILGVVTAIYFKTNKIQSQINILVLFALSYLFFFTKEPLLLSIVYPFVISYYNVHILQTLIKKDLKTLAIYMIFIGWIASGTGLFIALTKTIVLVPLVFLLYYFFKKIKSYKKELYYV